MKTLEKRLSEVEKNLKALMKEKRNPGRANRYITWALIAEKVWRAIRGYLES